MQFRFRYRDAIGLVGHLRAMGETAALTARRTELPRDTALAAAAIYAADQAAADAAAPGGGADGGVEATFDVIFLTGWSPAPDQARPSARGSATVSLKDLAGMMDGTDTK